MENHVVDDGALRLEVYMGNRFRQGKSFRW